ncbi:MAG: HAD family phosphatase [Oligoflexia bacterium]|nr:HAD family phosphatase [Oligoflexia bacterium]
MRSLRGVVLDLDGLLADTEPLFRASIPEVAAQIAGRALSDDLRNRVMACLGRSHRDMSLLVLAVLKEHGFASRWENGDLAFHRHFIHQHRGWFEAAARRGEIKPMPGAIEFVQWFAKNSFSIGLNTGSPGEFVDLVLDAIGLSKLIPAPVRVHGSMLPAGYGKPHPFGYQLAAEFLGIPAESCIAAEDRWNGTAAALSARFRAVVVVPEGGDKAPFESGMAEWKAVPWPSRTVLGKGPDRVYFFEKLSDALPPA